MEMLLQLNQVIEQAVPDSVGREKMLDDVLRAQGTPYFSVDGNGFMELRDSENYRYSMWYLGKPLSEQSTETLAFLASILCPSER